MGSELSLLVWIKKKVFLEVLVCILPTSLLSNKGFSIFVANLFPLKKPPISAILTATTYKLGSLWHSLYLS